MSIRILFASLLLATLASGRSGKEAPRPEETHYPNLFSAELPLYPPIAQSAHIAGTVEIQVTVENGSVVDTQVRSAEIQILGPDHPPKNDAATKLAASPYLVNPSLANVKTWRFQPEARSTFVVKYVYRIEGDQTPLPENPIVELTLPLVVKVTARPFKPTCNDCRL